MTSCARALLLVVAVAGQDKADLPPTLDSWYMLTQGAEHVGFARERLSRQTLGNWRWDFRLEAELDMMVPDPRNRARKVPHVESTRVDARLDDSYAPVTFRQTGSRNGIDVVSNVTAEETGRRIDVWAGGAGPRTHRPASDEEVHYSRALLFLFLRQNEFLTRPGTRRAILFHPGLEDRPPLAEIQLEVQEMSTREYLGKRVPVTRIVYRKPPPAASRDAELVESYVDKFGRVVEETTRGGLKRILARDGKEAMGSDRRVWLNARRDPFPRPLPGRDFPDDADAGEPAVIVPNDIAQAIKDMQISLGELHKARDERREADGDRHYAEVARYFLVLTRRNEDAPLKPEDLAQVQALRRQAEQIWGGVARLVKRLGETHARILRHFDREECAELEAGLRELKKATTDEPALQFMPEQAEVARWIAELEPLVARCRTRQELAKKTLLLTGTTIHEKVEMIHLEIAPVEIRFMKPERLAVINGASYREGDVVEGEGVRVERIWRHGVQVSLRGEMRDIPMRQK